jgi:hypothetical protein
MGQVTSNSTEGEATDSNALIQGEFHDQGDAKCSYKSWSVLIRLFHSSFLYVFLCPVYLFFFIISNIIILNV